MAEEKNIATGYIGNALRSAADNHTTTFADEIFDTERQKYQNEVTSDLETTDNEIKAGLTSETARAQAAEEANAQAIAEEKAAIMGTDRIADGAVTIEKLADNAFDDKPIAGSNNLVKSGVVADKISELELNVNLVKNELSGEYYSKIASLNSAYQSVTFFENIALKEGCEYTLSVSVETNYGNLTCRIVESGTSSIISMIKLNGADEKSKNASFVASKDTLADIIVSTGNNIQPNVLIELVGQKGLRDELCDVVDDMKNDVNTVISNVDNLKEELLGVSVDKTVSVEIPFEWSLIADNFLFKKGQTYIVYVSVVENNGSVTCDIKNKKDDSRIERMTLNGHDELFKEYRYTPNEDVLGYVQVTSNTTQDNITAGVKSSELGKLENIEKELSNIAYGFITKELAYIERGELKNGLPLAIIDVDSYRRYENSIRSGRLIKTKHFNLSLKNSIIEVFVLDSNFNITRRIKENNTVNIDLADNEEYVNFQVSFFEHSSLTLEKGSIDNSGQDTDGTNLRVKGYLTQRELFNLIFDCGFAQSRAYIYAYDENYNFIKVQQKEVSASDTINNIGEQTLGDFLDSRIKYYRIYVRKSYLSLSDEEYNSIKVYSVVASPTIPSIKTEVSKTCSEVCLPFQNDTINGSYQVHSYLDNRYMDSYEDRNYSDESVYFTNYLLKLPLSYTQEGKPTRCIIWCGGTGAYAGWQNSDFSAQKSSLDFWVANGYAVVSFLGLTSKYLDSYYSSLNDFGLPTSMTAHAQGLKYITTRYNIASDGCFVSCMSMGGLPAAQMLFEKKIPILAACLMAPKLDAYMTSMTMDGIYKGAEVYANELHFDEGWKKFFDGSSYTAEEKESYMKSQIRKTMGTQPLLNGIVGKTIDELYNIGRNARSDKQSLANCSRYCNTPTKIICSVGDVTIDYNLSKQFIISLQNGGSPAFLSAYPEPKDPTEGTIAGHHVVSSTRQGPYVESFKTSSGEIYTNVVGAFVECLQFFRQSDPDVV